MRLGDYADGAWMFVATCDTCGRQTRVDPAEVLTHPRTHPHMRVGIVKLGLTVVFDAQYGGVATGWSPVSWGLIDELFVNLSMPCRARVDDRGMR